jgi:hypothetical protein
VTGANVLYLLTSCVECVQIASHLIIPTPRTLYIYISFYILHFIYSFVLSYRSVLCVRKFFRM